MGFRAWSVGLFCCLWIAYAQDDPRTSYESYETVTPYVWNVPEGQVRWHYSLPRTYRYGAYDATNSSLVIARDQGLAFFLGEGYVHALELNTGKILWQHLDKKASGLAYVNGHVIVQTGRFDKASYRRYSTLYALEANIGEEVWRLPEFQSDNFVLADDVLLISVPVKQQYLLIAFDTTTGHYLWRVKSSNVYAFWLRDLIGSVAILDTAYSGEPSFNGLLALDLATGTLLWETIGVINYFGSEQTRDGDWQILARSDEWLGPYNPIYRPGAFVIDVYDLHTGLKEERVYDLTPETCQGSCPNAQWVEHVSYENGFVYVETKTNGVSRFPIEKDFLAREQVTFSDELWLAGPYQDQLFTSDGHGITIRSSEDFIMGGWSFGDAPVSRLDVEDNWLLVSFKGGDVAVANLQEKKVVAHWSLASHAFEQFDFTQTYFLDNLVFAQANNILYALEFPH